METVKNIARLLYEIFFEGCTHYSVARMSAKGTLAYHSTEGVPTLELIEQHLAGEVVLGAYTIVPGDKVRWIAFDVDSSLGLEKAREIAKRVADCLGENIPYIVEWSGRKGYHIIILLEEWVSARDAKLFGDGLREMLGIAKSGDVHMEVFPKQAALTDENPRGSLLRLPLGVHPSTKNYTVFVDPYNGWEEGPHKDPTEMLKLRVSFAKLKSILEDFDPHQQLVKTLLPYWVAGQRHDMALYTSGYLGTLGWAEEDVELLVRDLHEESGAEGDINNQLEAVRDTFKKISRGENVAGFQGLSEVLPTKILQRLTELAGKQISSPIMQVIDRIRLGKGAPFLKVRSASKTILMNFKERGRLIQDLNYTYWLDRTTRTLHTLGGSGWDRLMHTHYGLNPLDSFGRQVMKEVELSAQEQAQKVSVYRRSFWDSQRLLLNLGGPEVYILNGDPRERKMILNGDNDILFNNADDPMRVPDLTQIGAAPLNPWNYLVNDVNFMRGENATATPAQQQELLKAFTISVFFAQAMPTRPLLTILANAGAGKTTTARRILRFIEGPNEDVLALNQDKPDSLRASIANHKILAIDNIEKTKAAWLTDMLNRLSTGSHIEMRVLHTTNNILKIVPDCFVIITATDMPFSEETVFSRMLPLQLAPIGANRRPEHDIQTSLLENYNAMWLGMMDDLDQTIRQLCQNRVVNAVIDSRLADFTVFCHRIQGCDYLEGGELLNGLKNLTNSQQRVLQENSPFVQTLEIWLRTKAEEAKKWHTAGEINSHLQRVAGANHISWRWSSGQGLARHISGMETVLVESYGLKVRNSREGNREIRQYKFENKSLKVV